ncbi:hypothetical protein MYXO_03849 [Myxococcaceae bacterium]|nr:hypothetical protein MYXO_03849 [Myxococcaceae bacterium]
MTVIHEPKREIAVPRGIPGPAIAACVALIALGVLSFAYGLTQDPATAWRAYHVNFLYWASLAQGGVVIACIFVTVGAHWPGPIRRLAEALSAFVPLAAVLGIVGFLGRDHIYPWIEHPVAAKAAWLNVPRLVLTDAGILIVLAGLTLAFLYHSIRPTLHGMVGKGEGAASALTRGWRGDAEEQQRSLVITKRIAPILLLCFAFGYSIIGFDQVMSLSPMWYSNLFGAYFAWGGFLAAVAATALLATLNRARPGFEGEITSGRLHDIGKMVFAFSVFWMYLFWSQYLPIWYGNLPEETFFLEARLGSQFFQSTWDIDWARLGEPWVKLTLAAWLCCWVVPFWVLLGQRPKRTPAILGTVGCVVLFGFWLERNVLVWPSFSPKDPSAWIGPIQIGIALGFLGTFVLSYLVFTRVFPTLAAPRRS